MTEIKCPKCGGDIMFYLLTATFHPPGTKIGRCVDCGYEITNTEGMELKRKEMRTVGAFTKYCANCGETFGCDDLDEFLKMVEDHKCRVESGKGKDKGRNP